MQGPPPQLHLAVTKPTTSSIPQRPTPDPSDRDPTALSDQEPTALPAPERAELGSATSAPWASSEAFTHDVRNLLTALGLYADLLQDPGVLSPRHQHYAGELRLLADRACALLGRVHPVASAPVPSSAFRIEEPLCDAGVVLRRFLPLLQAQTAGAATVVLHVPANMPPLPVSAEALERIAANLVCNAAQAMRSEGQLAQDAAGTISITLQARDGAARLTVEDSGPGMSPAAANAFLRPEVASFPHREPGRGWGHRIVYGLVTETGGRLAVRPRSGGGTVVAVRWPLPASAMMRFYAPDPASPVAGNTASKRPDGKVSVAC